MAISDPSWWVPSPGSGSQSGAEPEDPKVWICEIAIQRYSIHPSTSSGYCGLRNARFGFLTSGAALSQPEMQLFQNFLCSSKVLHSGWYHVQAGCESVCTCSTRYFSPIIQPFMNEVSASKNTTQNSDTTVLPLTRLRTHVGPR